MVSERALIWGLPALLLGIFAWLNLPICPTRVLFGIFCPGCGLTRGSLALLGGDLDGMLHFHPLAPLMGPMLGWIILHGLLVEIGRIEPGGRLDLLTRLPRSAWVGIGVLFLGVWAARVMGALGGFPNPLFEPDQSLLFGGQWPDS